MNDLNTTLKLCVIASLLSSCMMSSASTEKTVPALEYSQKVRNQYTRTDTDSSPAYMRAQPKAESRPVAMQEFRSPYPQDSRGMNTRTRSPRQDAQYVGHESNSRAQLRYVGETQGEMEYFEQPAFAGEGQGDRDMVTNMGPRAQDSGYQVYRSSEQRQAPYRGPLTLGDPGATASLWQESRGRDSLFRDFRAFQPMDVITIVVQESSEGSKEADTEVKEETDVLAGITDFFTLATDLEGSNPGLDKSSIINATTQNDFKGEGATTRKGTLKSRISAMVVEILPSGVMRIEGEKIISVNSEEQVMVISGLVRKRDVNSKNEVMSGNVANLRVDFYGQGVVGEAQDGGWLSRLMRKVWPF